MEETVTTQAADETQQAQVANEENIVDGQQTQDAQQENNNVDNPVENSNQESVEQGQQEQQQENKPTYEELESKIKE